MKLLELRKLIQEELRIVQENSAAKVYKVEGLLVTDSDKKTQGQILSDIRSVTGVTTVDIQEYTPYAPKKGYVYDKLTVKIDPYPFLKTGKFDIETIKQVITNIGAIKGVVKFRVDEPQLINVGI